MPKISAYPDGGALQDTDQLVVNRGGKEYRVVQEVTEVVAAYLGTVQVPATTTWRSCPFKPTANTTGNNFPWPNAGTLHNMLFRLGSPQPATGSLVITLLVNNVATALTITVPAGSVSATYSNTADDVTISANDLLQWTFLNNASSDSGFLNAISMVLRKN
jgi:hypothetical protein